MFDLVPDDSVEPITLRLYLRGPNGQPYHVVDDRELCVGGRLDAPDRYRPEQLSRRLAVNPQAGQDQAPLGSTLGDPLDPSPPLPVEPCSPGVMTTSPSFLPNSRSRRVPAPAILPRGY